MADWSENAKVVLSARYLADSETPDEMLVRVAKCVSQAEDEKSRKYWENKFLSIMNSLQFLPNSPTLINAGRRLGQLSGCFVLPVEDDISSIFEAVKQSAIIHKSGGGTGFNFSQLRPSCSVVASTRGVASGPVSFMRAFDIVTEIIKQGGVRRGANMGILNITHPDLIDFIECKNGDNFQNFNISVAIWDSFFVSLFRDSEWKLHFRGDEKKYSLRARDIFEKLCYNAWKSGEPGVLFLSTINNTNPIPWMGRIDASNPCISGHSLIHTTRGKVAIKDLVGKNPWVFCSTGNSVELRRANNVRLTKSNAKVFKMIVSSENGKKNELVATPEHLVMMFDGSYRQLKDLVVGDSIMPFYQYKRNQKGYRQLNNFGRCLGEAHFVLEKKIGRPLVKGEIPHHVDGDKTNNDPENLELVNQREHDRVRVLGENNPIHKLTLEGKNPFQRPGFTSEMNLKTWKDTETRRKRIEGIRKSWERRKKFENHKVVSVEFYGYEDVYNMEVEGYYNFATNGMVVHNCGEQPLLPWESCNLGSINLSKFVGDRYIELESVVRLAVRFLDDVISVNKFPRVKIENKTKLTRKIGLGVMGWADYLAMKGIQYDSEEALEEADKVSSFIYETALSESQKIGKEKGFCFQQLRRRNSTIMTIAPTGTLSILADCSNGIEPYFAKNFTKNVLNGTKLEFGSISSNAKTALEISPKGHVEMQAAFQKNVDNAISKTINLPNDATVGDVKDAVLLAQQLGCKGLTVYRQGSRDEAPLEELSECENDRCLI